jgi:hypothetical protein
MSRFLVTGGCGNTGNHALVNMLRTGWLWEQKLANSTLGQVEVEVKAKAQADQMTEDGRSDTEDRRRTR